ncbi:MAG: cob(I)yrinic acid a,c-diamide adenosyltransferase [Armatimonadota bacterium]
MSDHLLSKGLISVYTGSGRGKTTAALGLALRVLGWGGRVCVVQFIKGYSEIGEAKFGREFTDRFTLKQFASSNNLSITEDDVVNRHTAAQEALTFAEAVISEGSYDLVILDEINNAMHYNLVDVSRVIKMLQTKPAHVELVLTGRLSPDAIIELADYVTEMQQIKHPFESGITARRGIDY